MKKIFISFLLLSLGLGILSAQGFQEKEWLKYRVHYGFLNAGFATLEVKSTTYNGSPHYHVVGKGSSSGAVRAVFKVDDKYETYIDKSSLKPSKFIRKISEGGHKKDRVLTFDHKNKVVTINDRRAKKVKFKRYTAEVQDMISAFYHLRTMGNRVFQKGNTIIVNVFMDGDTYLFKLKVEGKERVKTKFGYIDAIKMKPYVQSGRVFKKEESVTMWVSDDENLIPLKVKAELAVGSLEMDLYNYKNVKYGLDFDKK